MPRTELLGLPSAGVRMYVYLPRVDRDVTTSGDFSLVPDGDSDSMICHSGTSRNRLHKLYISFQSVVQPINTLRVGVRIFLDIDLAVEIGPVAHPRLKLLPDTPIETWVLRLIFDR